MVGVRPERLLEGMLGTSKQHSQGYSGIDCSVNFFLKPGLHSQPISGQIINTTVWKSLGLRGVCSCRRVEVLVQCCL